MKALLPLCLLLASLPALAEPTVFGLTLAKSTESDMRQMYEAEPIGQNRYSDGPMYSIPKSSIEFEGLKNVTAIFDEGGVLQAVLTDLPKHKCDYLRSALSQKYTAYKEVIPFVGDKLIVYRSESTEITLSSPHMSFDMSMNYVTDEFMKRFEQRSAEEKKSKEATETLQL